ncbi:MAG: asparagine synthase (glutamine-hydrolyzing) [Planctomycetota bacterium]
MCGIAGAMWQHPSKEIDDGQLRRMTEIIAHRGPDDSQTWTDREHLDAAGNRMGVALGFRRLSIIDIAGAAQPMTNETGDVHMVFNGEIYNYRTIRKRLEGAGHHFATHGDGECILHLYEDLGPDCFEHLNGMFGVAIWDARQHRLVLARDRIGQKPLYYAWKDGRFVFASELKSIATVPGICTEIDPEAIDEFLTYQYVPHPGTIWKGVHKLSPGHLAIVDRDGVRVRRYWEYDPALETDMKLEDVREQLRALLSDAVRLRMRSDVPLGSFLSGGIDSSLITALATDHTDQRLRTFSIGFPVADFDETRYADQVAQHLGTEHTKFEVQPDAIEILNQLVWHYDEPFGDSSAVPTWYLSELTRRSVTVALSGDGGDELFAGYERYQALWLSDKIQKLMPLHRIPGAGLWHRLPDSDRRRSLIRRGKRFLEAMGQPTVARYLNWLQIFPESLRGHLYTDEFVSRLPGNDPIAFLESVWSRSEGRDVVTRASTADLLSYLPCDLMTKVDIASMAHGLEVRQPMLDHRVVEFAARMPVHHKFRGRRGKLVLQDTFGDRIPSEIFTRPKMGFGIPIGSWFRNEFKPLVHDTLLASDARSRQFFRPDAVASLVQSHESGEQNHGYRLWNLLVLEVWLRQQDGDPIATP